MLDNVVAHTNLDCEKSVFDSELCIFNFQLDSRHPQHYLLIQFVLNVVNLQTLKQTN